MKYKMKKKKSTLPKSLKESKDLKEKLRKSPITSQKSPTSSPMSKPITNNPFEVLSTDAPRTVNINDLLQPRIDEVSKKRGRPRKIQSGDSSGKFQSGANEKPNQPPNNSMPLGAPTPVLAHSAIKPLLKAPFTAAAQATEIPEIALTEREADDLVPGLEAVMNRYSGALKSPHAALIMFSVSISVISFQKLLIYKSVTKEREKIKREKDESNGSKI
jgi:hypothetical protein